ncbi:hypothetical protein, partial [Duffyella sp. Ts4]|uniref:hypothetical protein n=1 Tax=Duffyella sp. Ts4 TaxID=3402768 RepID=UPI003F6EC1C9
RPCQGRGREFESRFPLQNFFSSSVIHSDKRHFFGVVSLYQNHCEQSYPQSSYFLMLLNRYIFSYAFFLTL